MSDLMKSEHLPLISSMLKSPQTTAVVVRTIQSKTDVFAEKIILFFLLFKKACFYQKNNNNELISKVHNVAFVKVLVLIGSY